MSEELKPIKKDLYVIYTIVSRRHTEPAWDEHDSPSTYDVHSDNIQLFEDRDEFIETCKQLKIDKKDFKAFRVGECFNINLRAVLDVEVE